MTLYRACWHTCEFCGIATDRRVRRVSLRRWLLRRPYPWRWVCYRGACELAALTTDQG